MVQVRKFFDIFGKNDTSTAIFIFFAGLFITGLFFYQYSKSIENRGIEEFNNSSLNIGEKLDAKVQDYVQLLYTIKGLYGASDTVTRKEFDDFITNSRLQELYPEVSSVSIVNRINADNITDFEEQVRLDTSLDEFDPTTFNVFPEASERRTYLYPLIYIAPYSGREAAVGFDISSEAKRLQALQQAILTGQATATAPINFVTDANGFFFVVPVSGNDVFALLSIRTDDFFELFNQDLETENINYEIHSIVNSQEYLVYGTNSPSSTKNIISTAIFSQVENIKFKLNTSTNLGYINPFTSPIIILGILFSYLIANLYYLIAKSRSEVISQYQEFDIQNRAKEQAILQSIGDALFAVDIDGRVLVVNNAFTELTGLGYNQIIGKELISTLKLYDHNNNLVLPHQRPLNKALENNKSYIPDKQLFYKLQDGSKLPISLSVSPITIDGEVIGAVEVFRDVTREYELSKSKTEFVSMASHQLRTPLTAIKWNIEILEDDILDNPKCTNEVIIETLDEIKNGNSRMVKLVNNLLNISRIELGSFAIDPQLKNLEHSLKTIVGKVEFMAKDKDIDLVRQYNLADPMTMIDQTILEIAIENLLTNAIKYTPKNGEIRLVATQRDKYYYITISDTGIGIPTKEHKRLFEKFYRASNAVTGNIDGTGLGLYIIKSVLNTANCTIRLVRSGPDSGSTFEIQIPRDGMRAKAGDRRITNL